jgi:hypothetical protein
MKLRDYLQFFEIEHVAKLGSEVLRWIPDLAQRFESIDLTLYSVDAGVSA